MSCACCGKVGLYRVGLLTYCRAHAHEAQRVQALVIRDRERSAHEYESNQRAIERAMRRGDTRSKPRYQ